MSEIVHRSALLRCKPDRAFGYFTNNELLGSWLADSAHVEPVVGGKYEIFWDPAIVENDGTRGCKVTAIEPGKFLSFDWKGPTMFQQSMNAADPLTHVVVFFIPHWSGDESGTEVHLVHSGWGSGDEWEGARLWFDNAWRLAFAALERLANGDDSGQSPATPQEVAASAASYK
ncbi:MAG: SRPBCC domain-containing protein [Chloroflexota bacterium]|nr:SRPBCC domain-containing protein [Chloroflexota bacterium]